MKTSPNSYPLSILLTEDLELPAKPKQGTPWDSGKPPEWKDINKLEKPRENLPKDVKKDEPIEPHRPAKEEDSDVLTRDDFELELEEAFSTPDVGMSVLGRSLYTGAAMEPANGYDKNFCPDPPAPEEATTAQAQDQAGTLIAPKQFIPREERKMAPKAIQEAAEYNRMLRLSKFNR